MEEKRGVSFMKKKTMVELNQREIEELLGVLHSQGGDSQNVYELYNKLIDHQWELAHEKYNKSGIETY